MSPSIFPAELLHKVADWIFHFEDMETLKSLALTAQCLVTHAQTLLFQHIAFSASGVRRPGEFLKALEVRPNLAYFVKSVTLKQSALQLKASIEVLHRLQNVERIIIHGGEYYASDIYFLATRGWSWNRLSPTAAASISTIGKHLPHLKEFVFRDIEDLPIAIILENSPQLMTLELTRTKCVAVAAELSHSLTSFRWTLNDQFLPQPEVLFGSKLTHLHLTAKTKQYSPIINHPSCKDLKLLQSLVLEVHHDGSVGRNVAEDSLSFFLGVLGSVPNTAPLESVTTILRDIRNVRHGWGTRTDWAGIHTVIAKQVAIVVVRLVSLKKFTVKMFGFTGCEQQVRDALAFVDVATEVEVVVGYNSVG
ncbi:hypothetical protein DL96DRAFT_1821712 [Flagelloscypha sp. PMI_526]|nr:hypothetical protein DL96DRAFT_1821712 [Flagelloscypha sp. PMI_526]